MNGMSLIPCGQSAVLGAGRTAVQGKYITLSGKRRIVEAAQAREAAKPSTGKTASAQAKKPAALIGKKTAKEPCMTAAGQAGKKTAKEPCMTVAGQAGKKTAAQAREAGAAAGKAERTGESARNGRRRRAGCHRISPFAVRSAVFCALFLCTIICFRMMIRASSRPEEKLWKYYTTVHIGEDQDLSDLARENMEGSAYASEDDYIREVCEINSLPYRKGAVPELRPGAMVVIPYYSNEPKLGAEATSAARQ